MAIKSPPKIGKGNSLFYALIVAGFLTWNTISWSHTRDGGWEFKSKEAPLAIVTPCLVLMGVALGINLSGAFQAIANIATIVTRNSAAISTLAAKTGTELLPEENTKLLELKDNSEDESKP